MGDHGQRAVTWPLRPMCELLDTHSSLPEPRHMDQKKVPVSLVLTKFIIKRNLVVRHGDTYL